jgi:hypothetical protein
LLLAQSIFFRLVPEGGLMKIPANLLGYSGL